MNKVKSFPSVSILIGFICGLLLTGCGESSMRIEVEVYKGYLSREKAIQEEEAQGIFEEAKNSLSFLSNNLQHTADNVNCELDSEDKKKKDGIEVVRDHIRCRRRRRPS